jgi:hypothetical protein
MEQLRMNRALPRRTRAHPGSAPAPRAAFQRGSTTIGLTLILPLLAFLLAVPMFLAQAVWYYSVAHKAAHDAARFLSNASRAEMRHAAGEGSEARVVASARWIAESGTAALRAAVDPRAIGLQCGAPEAGGRLVYGDCGAAVPETIRVHIGLVVRDALFPGVQGAYFRPEPLHLTAVVTLRYAGN